MNIFLKSHSSFFSKLTPQSSLLLGFILLILLGSLLLSQPFSLSNKSIDFIDALFTSTSATCVTGLTVLDTGSFFSKAGQFIILFLIQVGGLGVMTFSTLFLFFLRGNFGIGSREVIQETLSFFDTIDIGELLKSVFLFTFVIEGIGALLLSIRFYFDMPFTEAVFSGIFHSVSAFCNAGFSIFPDSLVKYQSDFYVNFVISSLIILGGIGFVVLYEFKRLSGKNFSLKDFSLHSRVVIKTSFFLIVIGALLIFLFEYNVSMKNFNSPTKLLVSFFQSITARTAGFNTLDFNSVSISSLFVIITLMIIGASPASCGGGIKTSTLIVILFFIKSKIQDSKNVNIGFNTLPFKVISKAIVIFVFAVTVILIFSFVIAAIELEHIHFNANGTKFLEILFEVISAFGTVGLSTGITQDFSLLGRFLLIILMFLGRIGPLTIAVAIGYKKSRSVKYAEDNILVG